MTTFRTFQRLLAAVLLAAPGADAAPAIPDTYTVGYDASCDYSNLQTAIDDARTNGLAMTTLQLASDFYGLDLEVHGQSLTIVGGYDSCGGRQGPDRTLLNGENIGIPEPAPVIRFSDGGTGPETIILRQVRIQGGDPAPGVGGGGLQVYGPNLVVLENVLITDNAAQYGGGIEIAAGTGAKVYADERTIIRNNDATDIGGGVRCFGPGVVDPLAEPAALRIQGTVRGNTANYGGGIAAMGCSIIVDTEYQQWGIRENSATGSLSSGGGIYATHQSHVFLLGTRQQVAVSMNYADVWGGGIYLFDSELSATNAIIANNAVLHDGGGLYLEDSTARFDTSPVCVANRCSEIRNNDASGITAEGGAIYQSGGSFTARNTWIVENTATEYSAVYSDAGAIDLETTIIARNRTASWVLGLYGGTHSVRLSTIADNRDAQVVIVADSGQFELLGSIIQDQSAAPFAYVGLPANANVACLLVQPLTIQVFGDEILDADPQFVDPASGNYHLKASSPAIDFCDNRVSAQRVEFDIDGELRNVDFGGAVDHLGHWDLGADEVQEGIFGDGFEGG